MELVVVLFAVAILAVAATVIAVKYPVWLWAIFAAAVLVVSCASADVPAGTHGGGGWQWVYALIFVLLIILLIMQRCTRIRLEGEVLELTKQLEQLEVDLAPEFSLRDIVAIYRRQNIGDEARLVLVQFTSIAGMEDFHRWAVNQSKRAKGRK